MGIIKVNNIKIYSNHGCLEEEAKIGSWYRVDVKIKADLKKSAKTDDLSDTVDYVHLNHIVKQEMAIRSKLLEEVAERILNRFFQRIRNDKKSNGFGFQNKPANWGQCRRSSYYFNKKKMIVCYSKIENLNENNQKVKNTCSNYKKL
jgi:dihydroneopterin aldolase